MPFSGMLSHLYPRTNRRLIPQSLGEARGSLCLLQSVEIYLLCQITLSHHFILQGSLPNSVSFPSTRARTSAENDMVGMSRAHAMHFRLHTVSRLEFSGSAYMSVYFSGANMIST